MNKYAMVSRMYSQSALLYCHDYYAHEIPGEECRQINRLPNDTDTNVSYVCRHTHGVQFHQSSLGMNMKIEC
jgi:hypothetical protein